jgi:hypothetical protein
MCQLTFCTTVHQNSQFAINYAINIEWISDGMPGAAAKKCAQMLCGLRFR